MSDGLEAHFDYFLANRNTVIAANRVLDATGLEDHSRELVSAVLMSWLVFVRTLCVDWLTNQTFSRGELHEMCIGALRGALGSVHRFLRACRT